MKKVLCALLALIMVTACFAACGGNEEGNSSQSDVIGEYESGTESTGEKITYADKLPAAEDMGGREFYVYQRKFGSGKVTIDFQGEVIWEETEDGELTNINKAKYDVVEEVQKKYNCTITGEIVDTSSAAEVRTAIQEDIVGGTAEYDFCFETYYYYYQFALDGMLVNLHDLGIDFDQAWWDQNAVKDMSICDQLYYALGDINTYDNDGTFVLLFNKALYKENGGDPAELYKMAADGDWTFEEFKNIVTGFGKDANADGVRDEFDIYGLLTETSNLYNHFLASGNKTVEKNANDEPELSLATGDGYPALTDAVDLYLNDNDVLVANLEKYVVKYEGEDVYEKTVTNAFKEGRGLFYMTSLIHLPYFRDMEDEFGFLPIPKYNASDDRYYHNMGAHTSSVLFVPNSPANVEGEAGEQLGMIIDALGAYSKDILTPEYYEKQLKRGDAQDSDSADMLDIVFGSRVFDLGQVFGSPWSITETVEVLDKNIASRVESKKDSVELKMARAVSTIKERLAGE